MGRPRRRWIDRVPKARIWELVTKGVYEMIDEGILRRLGHVERMEKDRIARQVYVAECAGSCSVGKPRKRLD